MVHIEELECACCYELMVNPTTLNCGHSFCKYCLAKWFNASNKTECPECRQMWIGFPHVNVHLRTIVETSFPKETENRKAAQLCLQDYSEVVEKFQALGSSTGQQAVNLDDRMIHGIIVLIFLAACIVVALLLIGFLYYVFAPISKPREAIYSKTVDQWTPLDVATWAHGFTKQLHYDYSMRFAQAGVDGQLLVELTDDDLESLPLNISTPLHRKIFIGEITRLNMTRVKHPTNLWEYKDAHRGNVLFLLFMLQDSPRLTFVYLHYMEYNTIFLPFLHAAMDTDSCPSDGIICPTIEDITVSEKLKFYVKVVLCPYYLILKYAWPFTDIHFITTWIIISHCVMLTFREFSRLHTLPGIIREFPSQITEFIVTFVITCIWYWSLLSIVPGFLLDIVFYGKLYYGPIETANRMRNGEFRMNILGKILNGVSVIGQGMWRIFILLLNRRFQA